MTIICVKDKIMVCDGRVSFSSGFISDDDFNKIILPEPGEKWTLMGRRVIGFGIAGSQGALFVVKDLLREGIYHDTKTVHKLGELHCLMMTEDFDLFYVGVEEKTDGITIHQEMDGSCAIGTGTLVAKAYMVSNKSAKDAVKLLVKTHTILGGTIREVDLSAFKEELLEKEKALPKDYVFVPKFQHTTPIAPTPKGE